MMDKQTRLYPRSVGSGFGRVFYGAQGRMYFSQVIVDDFSSLGKCFQKNDPTAEDMSDILDTDGGELLLQDAGKILKVQTFSTGVLLFCDNGVWFVGGSTEAGFSASGYIVSKVCPYVLYAPASVVVVKDTVLFAAKESLYAISDPGGKPTAQSVTEKTIDSYWKEFVTQSVSSAYDEANQIVHFVDEGTSGNVLTYNVKLSAWFPWKITLPINGSLIGAVFDDDDNKLRYCIKVGSSIKFVEQVPDVVQDLGADYESYIVTQPETVQNYSKDKGGLLVKVLMKRTESKILSYDGFKYQFDTPSSCVMQVKFDWDDSLTSTPREIYKYAIPRGYLPPTIPCDLPSKNSVVTFQDTVRGKGRSIQLRFKSTGASRMDLLGYTLELGSK